MASGIFGNAKFKFCSGEIDLIDTQLSALLLDLNSYTPNLDIDLNISDIPEAAIIAEKVLTGKSLTKELIGGISSVVFRCDDTVFSSVTTDKNVDGIVICVDGATYSDSILIFLIDDCAEFPITTDGTDITIEWDDEGTFIL